MFDDKEQIISFEFTQHGKRVYMTGKFSPEYYSFSDDDILYDASYASISEENNSAQDRILNETPRLDIIHNKHGVETDFAKVKKNFNPDEEVFFNIFQDQADKVYESLLSLGTSDVQSQYAPAWDIKIHGNSDIDTVQTHITGAISNVKIPQINLDPIRYDLTVIQGITEDIYDDIKFANSISSENVLGLIDEDVLLEVVPKEFIIEVSEENTAFKNSNFDLEVFFIEDEVISGSSGLQTREKLIPLMFKNRTIQDDVRIYDENIFDPIDIDESYDINEAGYYFDIKCDFEISDKDFCRYVPEDTRRGIYGTRKVCQEQKRRTISLRRSDITADDLAGECVDE